MFNMATSAQSLIKLFDTIREYTEYLPDNVYKLMCEYVIEGTIIEMDELASSLVIANVPMLHVHAVLNACERYGNPVLVLSWRRYWLQFAVDRENRKRRYISDRILFDILRSYGESTCCTVNGTMLSAVATLLLNPATDLTQLRRLLLLYARKHKQCISNAMYLYYVVVRYENMTDVGIKAKVDDILTQLR